MFLLIETSTSRGLIALCDEKTVINSCELALGLGNSRELEKRLVSLFEESGAKPADLTYVAAGRGPGSYTGMRVGAASAKALSLSLHIPLVGVSSLRAFVPPEGYEGSFLTCVDARIGGVYVLKGRREGERITFADAAHLIGANQFLEEVQKNSCIVTPSFEPLRQRFASLSEGVHFEVAPIAQSLASEARMKYASGEYSRDGALELLYLRLTQAEMEKLPNKQLAE